MDWLSFYFIINIYVELHKYLLLCNLLNCFIQVYQLIIYCTINEKKVQMSDFDTTEYYNIQYDDKHTLQLVDINKHKWFLYNPCTASGSILTRSHLITHAFLTVHHRRQDTVCLLSIHQNTNQKIWFMFLVKATWRAETLAVVTESSQKNTEGDCDVESVCLYFTQDDREVDVDSWVIQLNDSL